LLKVQSSQGAIFEIKAFDYLKRKLNGQLLPEVEDAAHAENQMALRRFGRGSFFDPSSSVLGPVAKTSYVVSYLAWSSA
jgi:hypothetical protein